MGDLTHRVKDLANGETFFKLDLQAAPMPDNKFVGSGVRDLTEWWVGCERAIGASSYHNNLLRARAGKTPLL
jgi:hypothetical protein